MKSLAYVKEHLNEFEEDDLFDRRFTFRFIQFIPTDEWEKYKFRYTGEDEYTPVEWTETCTRARMSILLLNGQKKTS